MSYGSDEGPFVELGIGLDFGEAYVGNIGQRALYDFTAVGDVVNTASRLQGQAAGGEIVISGRVAFGLAAPRAHAKSSRSRARASASPPIASVSEASAGGCPRPQANATAATIGPCLTASTSRTPT